VSWQNLFESYVSETDRDKLQELVFETEDAVFLRFRDLSSDPKTDELLELRHATAVLLEIKIKKTGWANPAAPE